MSVQEREKQFYDKEWQTVQVRKIEGKITIPGIASFENKRALICSCGSGIEPVQSAKQGAETFAFDVSETAVGNALRMAEYNGVSINAEVMDFHSLTYENDCFDIVYGSSILHHIDCSIAGREIYRVLKPGGIAFFRENSEKNPFLRLLRRLMFGKPGGYQRQRFLFIKRTGTTDEYPLTDDEIQVLFTIFEGNAKVCHERFYFFSLLNFLVIRNEALKNWLWSFDAWLGDLFPFIKKYSFLQEVWLQKPNLG